MIIRNRPDKKRKTLPYFLIFCFMTVSVFTSYYFYQMPLFDYSLQVVRNNNQNESVRDFLGIAEGAANFFGSHGLFNLMILLVYNYANIYKTSMLIIAMSTSQLVAGLLKMVYRFPLMYMYDENINIRPISCSATWGIPSSQSITTTCVYLTLWKIAFDNARLRYKLVLKIICLIVFIVLIFFIDFVKFLSALHSLDQIVIGMLIGFLVFFFLFYIIEIDLNDGKYLVKYVKIKFVHYLLAFAGVLGVVSLIYFVMPYTEDIKRYEKNLENSECRNLPNSLKLSNEALLLCTNLFANLGIVLGMKCELKFSFKNNEMNWRQYNFSKEKSDEESLLSKLSISKESQWNHTTFFFSLLRLIVVCLTHFLILAPYLFIKFNSPILVVIFVKIFLPVFILNFSMFYLEKFIIGKIGLTNDAIFKLMSENL
jgi:hypothetical protein